MCDGGRHAQLVRRRAVDRHAGDLRVIKFHGDDGGSFRSGSSGFRVLYLCDGSSGQRPRWRSSWIGLPHRGRIRGLLCGAGIGRTFDWRRSWHSRITHARSPVHEGNPQPWASFPDRAVNRGNHRNTLCTGHSWLVTFLLGDGGGGRADYSAASSRQVCALSAPHFRQLWRRDARWLFAFFSHRSVAVRGVDHHLAVLRRALHRP